MSNLQTSAYEKVDFSQLDNPSTYSLFTAINFVALAALVLGAISIITATYLNEHGRSSEPYVVVGTALVAGTITTYSMYWSLLSNRSAKKNITAFVQINNWQSSPTQGVDHIATSLLADGHSFKIQHAFNGSYQDLGFEARVVSYVTGYNRNPETHNFVCLQFSHEQVIPFIQITSWVTKITGAANLKYSLAGAASLQLEGNFNKYFHLSIVPGTQQRVLQFMTPDFMSELLDLPLDSNFEFADTNMFVIVAFADVAAYQLGAAIRQAFMVANAGIKQINDISRSWDASVSHQEIKQLAVLANKPRVDLFAGAPEPW